MILNHSQKSDLYNKIDRVLIELDKSDFVKKAAETVPLEKREKLCFYYKYDKNASELFFSCAWGRRDAEAYRAANTSLEVINLARELINPGKDLLGVKDDNEDIIKARRKLDELEMVYNEMDKSLSNTQLVEKLDAIIAAQKTLQQNQDAFAKILAEVESKLDRKPDKSELSVPDNRHDIFFIKNRVNELQDEVKIIANNINALKARADKEDKQLEQKKHRRLFG